ncbi:MULTISPECIES: Na/Pi symporter [unclassified Oceanobacter]|jgi:sodium-dependent phosphate cotransporter|uniref:Na/Pi symporter n=1 Tax=unclassified Oceanobacter TaxID=2620260 RepID=UPI0026E16BA2|nr:MULTISPECIES: Na/Pi symporter [unclassified Oceanobacter]MDO6683552.1 Na/Pi symporter [Oceanobacter sp. 5_MG-2023]MDP2504787.1 Na/Pi symporter [Oceanobacter sp. 3_MG-2023]MDP2546230.1 Na/Pi symporter [Oceanobacter sp. 4_MG-2023]MDP2607532.1 Na/Pi symporter [Oceanobacter sp. 1_MG-2023]MDP2610800.1 Na/Pi symporter [Oceanobacter sp. 2_MG-2023]
MNDTTANASSPELSNSQLSPSSHWLNWLKIAGLVYLLLVSVSIIGGGFKLAAGEHAKELFDFASNPLTGLIVGTIATALIQSSSTVTSIIVGLVAGGLPVSIAIPMVMGANIGTTITNTIVSLGHVRKGDEFRRAFAAATVHDFFNLVSVVIFLPLEIMFGVLEKMGGFLASLMVGADSLSMHGFNFVKPLVKPPVTFIQQQLTSLAPDTASGILMVVLGIATIFVVITLIGKLLRSLLVGKAKAILHSAVGRGPVSGIASGTLMTILVQSSSTTTSLIVPLAGSGVFSLRQIYPFTLGANIGTCITALLAATAITGVNAIFALQIALVHLLYNVSAVILIYGIPLLRNIPLWAAEHLSIAASANKIYVGVYILGIFFVTPLVLIGGCQLLGI